MRIVFLGNNLNGYNILKYLVSREENIIGLVVHPPPKAKYRDEMITLLDLPSAQIFEGNTINSDRTLNHIKRLKPDLILSINFGYILKKQIINLPTAGCINLHTSLLPYNKGSNPNIWSIIESTPAGVTLHYIDEGVDTGEIIAQFEVPVEPVDTGQTLYRKLEQACLEFFQDTWPLIKGKRTIKALPPKSVGSSHRTADLKTVDCIDLDSTYKAKDLINILRARTFPPYPGAYFNADGRKVYMHLQLTYEKDL